MAANLPRIVWDDEIPFSSVDELDQRLDTIAEQCTEEHPGIARIADLHGCHVDIALGSKESFVWIWPDWERGPPNTYYLTVGNPDEEGTKWFWLQGVGDTEVDRWTLIPAELAREVLRQFMATGRRSGQVSWKQEDY